MSNELQSIEEKVIYKKLLQYCHKREDEEQQIYRSWIAEHIDDPKAEMQYVCRQLNSLKQKKDNFAYRVLPMDVHGIKKVVLYLKKAMRKCMKWYIEPICFQQTDFNGSATAAIGTTINVVADLERRIRTMEEQRFAQMVIRLEEAGSDLDEQSVFVKSVQPSVILVREDSEKLQMIHTLLEKCGYVNTGRTKDRTVWLRESLIAEDSNEHSI